MDEKEFGMQDPEGGAGEKDPSTAAAGPVVAGRAYAFTVELTEADAPMEKPGPTPEERRRAIRKEIWSWVWNLVVPMAVILLLNSFVCKLVRVQGSSMLPNLHDKDIIVVQMLGYEPEPGDIVVAVTDPEGVLHGEYIVKRVVAVGGQTVQIDYESNLVLVDGIQQDLSYINHAEDDIMNAGTYHDASYCVPEGCVFLMGDNRNHSTDSRSSAVGMVSEEDLLGGMILHLPLGKWLGK